MLSARASIMVLAPTSVICGFQPTIGHGRYEQLSFKSHSMKRLFWYQSGRINVQHHSAHCMVPYLIWTDMLAPYRSMRRVEPNSNSPNSRESVASVWVPVQKRPTAFHHNIFHRVQQDTPLQSTQHRIILESRPCPVSHEPNNTPTTPWNACQRCAATPLPLPKLQEQPMLLL